MTDDTLKAAVEVFRAQAGQFLSLNLLLLGGLVAQYFGMVERRVGTRPVWLLCSLAFAVPACLLAFNAYDCGDSLQQLLVYTRRGVEGREDLLRLLASAAFGRQLILIAMAAVWGLVGATIVMQHTTAAKV
jgi:hypothetical protein